MKGENVVVVTRIAVGVDDLNNPIYKSQTTTVENVLVAPGASKDIGGSIRPNGVEVKYTLHFPKAFNGSLRGCQVKVRDEWLDVIGDPKPYTPENCPGLWWLPAEVGTIHG